MPVRTHERLYTIREVCERIGIQEACLRFFESLYRGFLAEQVIQGDRVLYTEEAVSLFTAVVELRNQGITRPAEVIARIRQDREALGAEAASAKAGFGRVIVVTSGKGGVGKSNIALNLAIALVQQNKKTILIDADLGLANLHILCGRQPEKNLSHVVFEDRPFEDVVEDGPGGIRMVSGGSGLAELANLGSHHRLRLIEELENLEKTYDCVVVDTSPGISRGVTDFVRIGDVVLLITTPDLTSTTDAYGMLKSVLRTLRKSRIGIVCNQVQSRAQAGDIFTRLEICSRRFLGLDLEDMGYLPRDPQVTRANRIQEPFLMAAPDSRASQYTVRLAERVLESRPGEKPKEASTFRKMLRSAGPASEDPFLQAMASQTEIRILARD